MNKWTLRFEGHGDGISVSEITEIQKVFHRLGLSATVSAVDETESITAERDTLAERVKELEARLATQRSEVLREVVERLEAELADMTGIIFNYVTCRAIALVRSMEEEK